MTAAVHAHADRPDAGRRASLTQDEIARQVQARTCGRWLCWYGRHTGRYWAIGRMPGLFRLVEGETPEELLIVMREVEAYGGLLADPLSGLSRSRSRPA